MFTSAWLTMTQPCTRMLTHHMCSEPNAKAAAWLPSMSVSPSGWRSLSRSSTCCSCIRMQAAHMMTLCCNVVSRC